MCRRFERHSPRYPPTTGSGTYCTKVASLNLAGGGGGGGLRPGMRGSRSRLAACALLPAWMPRLCLNRREQAEHVQGRFADSAPCIFRARHLTDCGCQHAHQDSCNHDCKQRGANDFSQRQANLFIRYWGCERLCLRTTPSTRRARQGGQAVDRARFTAAAAGKPRSGSRGRRSPRRVGTRARSRARARSPPCRCLPPPWPWSSGR